MILLRPALGLDLHLQWGGAVFAVALLWAQLQMAEVVHHPLDLLRGFSSFLLSFHLPLLCIPIVNLYPLLNLAPYLL